MPTTHHVRDTAAQANAAVRAARHPGPEDEWAATAALLAARGRMRVSRDAGRNYRQRDERAVTETLPNQPAALLTYDHTGRAPVVVFDLDSSRGDTGRDHAYLAQHIERRGGQWFSDTSPNGGRHLYLPLRHPAPLHEVREVMNHLITQMPTLDPQPMLNIAAGCIRPPGARHKSGGHQRLDQPISRAVHALHARTGDAAWQALLRQARDANTAAGGPRSGEANNRVVDIAERLEALQGHHSPDADYLHIARTGTWDTAKYASASEARQAVLWACAASGWEFKDVARRTEDGTWPGLASLYARYGEAVARSALQRDWRRAVAFEASRRDRRKQATSAQHDKSVHQRTTSTHQSQRGALGNPAVNQEVRVWLAAVDLLARSRAAWMGLGEKAVLYALAEAAALTGAIEVEHGNRSLAIATGMDQATVGRCLRKLRSAPPDALLIDQVRDAEGARANCYRLVVPDLLRSACEKKPWRQGRIHAVRPAFRHLGLAAAFVYGALERAREPLTGREVAAEAGVGHSAGATALSELAAWNLATRNKAGTWEIGGGSLMRLAEQWGVDEDVAEQIARYRAERRAWWIYLGLWGRLIDDPPPDGSDERWASDPPQEPVSVPHDDRAGSASDGHSPASSWRAEMESHLRARDTARTSAAVALLRDVLGAEVVGLEGDGDTRVSPS